LKFSRAPKGRLATPNPQLQEKAFFDGCVKATEVTRNLTKRKQSHLGISSTFESFKDKWASAVGCDTET